jgi:beta-galactosidase GanA
MDKDGIFRGDGFAANLWELTRCVVRTVRWMGYTGWKAEGDSFSLKSPVGASVEWRDKSLAKSTSVGLEGFCEFLEVDPAAEIIATFQNDQAILNGRPAAAQRKLGKGSVVKLGFWPEDQGLLRLIAHLVPAPGSILAEPAPEGVVTVPHTDNSMFVVNTAGYEKDIQLARTCTDRLSGAVVEGKTKLQPYQVWWFI